MNTILKDETLKIDLKKKINLSKIIDTSWTDRLNIENFEFNNLNISYKEPFFIINNNKLNFDFKYNIPLYIKSKYSKFILDLNEKESIIVTDKDILLKYVYLDVYIYLELIFEKINKKENYIYYVDKINDIINNNNIEFKVDNKDKNTGKFWKRKELLEKNENALEWNDNNRIIINTEITVLLQNINANIVEIPQLYDKNKLVYGLKYINNILNSLNIKNRNFKLRFKKLKLYKKEGMFFKNNNTIIVDPRNINAFKHELGHYIFENNIPMTLNNKRLYKQDYINIIKKIKKENKNTNLINNIHSLEDYEIESEIFAYWFEQQ